MDYYLGQLLDHVHWVVSDLAASQRFYPAALAPLGHEISGVGPGHFFADKLFVSQGASPTHVHLAFQADGPETVQRFHQTGLQAGGRDNGSPSLRGDHPGDYGAYLLDPDGNTMEAVYHGPA
jgi:catechol 2,3-dioxygenase-like lactoylglutathione lyase family enzyme